MCRQSGEHRGELVVGERPPVAPTIERHTVDGGPAEPVGEHRHPVGQHPTVGQGHRFASSRSAHAGDRTGDL